tara:strand:- start:138217 stop:138588 length:372 start_codon:yes stop_codon:yes gene_type:complete
VRTPYISSKKLSEIDSEFEMGVFVVTYRSKKQRLRRKFAALILALKHGLRGFLFSWPLYLLPFSVLAMPDQYKYLFIIFSLPGLYVSFIILKKGIVEDYLEFVSDRLLNDGYANMLLFNTSRH